MLPCCWIRCCNSARPIGLYWRLQHLITRSSMFQSTLAGPAANLVTSPALFGGRCSFRRRGRLRCRGGRSSVGRGLDGVGLHWVLAWDHGWVGHGSSLGDELAGQVLGRWTSPSAGFLEDVVVKCGERVTELCPKFVRGHGIRFST